MTWIEYSPLIVVVIALINGSLLVVGTHFKPETKRTRITLVAAVIILNLLAIGASVENQSSVLRQARLEHLRRHDVREAIGKQIAQGRVCILTLQDGHWPTGAKDAQDWIERTREYLRSTLGPSYVARFDSDIGITTNRTTLGPPASQLLFYNVYTRVVRLEEFAAEIPADP